MRQPLGIHGATHLPDGQDPIPGIGYRQAFGQMYNDGTPINGPGSGDWTAAQGATDITITFSPAFASPPAVTAIPNDSASGVGPNPTGCSVVQVSVAAGNVVLRVVDSTGAATNLIGLNFQAISV